MKVQLSLELDGEDEVWLYFSTDIDPSILSIPNLIINLSKPKNFRNEVGP